MVCVIVFHPNSKRLTGKSLSNEEVMVGIDCYQACEAVSGFNDRSNMMLCEKKTHIHDALYNRKCKALTSLTQVPLLHIINWIFIKQCQETCLINEAHHESN